MKDILRNKRTQIFLALLIIFTVHTQVFTHFAFARSPGGGELAEFDTGKFVAGVGIGMVSSYVGGAISDGIGASVGGGNFLTGTDGVGGFYGTMSNIGNVGSWASSYNSMAALSQLGSGINMLGRSKGWDPSKTVLVSSVAQGVTGGFLNPSSTLGAGAASNATIKAMTVGAISGAAEGAILANNVGSDGTIKPWVSATAGLTGSFVGGVASSMISPVVPSKAGPYKDYVNSGGLTKDRQSFGPVNKNWYNQNVLAPAKANSFFGQALTHGAVRVFSAIPSQAISMGVNKLTKDMDRQDAFMARQAFRGIYPVVGTFYQNGFRDPALEKVGLGHYVGRDGVAGTELQKIDRQPKIPKYDLK